MAEEFENTQAEQSEVPEENTSAPPQNQPQQPAVDVTALQSQLNAMQAQTAQYQQAALAAQIAQQATLEAAALGIDVKTIPYVLKMADMSGITPKKDGTLDVEAIQAAVSKVLDDVPMLKPNKDEQSIGFRQIGAGGSDGGHSQSDELARIFGNKQ